MNRHAGTRLARTTTVLISSLAGFVAVTVLFGAPAPAAAHSEGAAADPATADPAGSDPATADPDAAVGVGVGVGEAASHRITVRGRVINGAEAGCLILVARGARQYLLLGGDPNVVRPGARLRVTGRLRPDIASFCQQGRPLQVTSASRIRAVPAEPAELR